MWMVRIKKLLAKNRGPGRVVWYLIWLPAWVLYVSKLSGHDVALAATFIAFIMKDVAEAAGKRLLKAPYLEHFPCCILVAAASEASLWVKALAVADGILDFLDDMGVIRLGE